MGRQQHMMATFISMTVHTPTEKPAQSRLREPSNASTNATNRNIEATQTLHGEKSAHYTVFTFTSDGVYVNHGRSYRMLSERAECKDLQPAKQENQYKADFLRSTQLQLTKPRDRQ